MSARVRKAMNNEGRLIKDLFEDYDPSVRPVVDEKDAVLIAIRLVLTQILQLVSVHSKITLCHRRDYEYQVL